MLDFKKEQRAKEIAEPEAVKAKKQGQVEQQEQRLKELAPAVRNMEQLEVKMENNALRGTVADFERVKQTFGPEEVERAVEEAAEKEQRRAKRKFSREVR